MKITQRCCVWFLHCCFSHSLPFLASSFHKFICTIWFACGKIYQSYRTTCSSINNVWSISLITSWLVPFDLTAELLVFIILFVSSYSYCCVCVCVWMSEETLILVMYSTLSLRHSDISQIQRLRLFLHAIWWWRTAMPEYEHGTDRATFKERHSLWIRRSYSTVFLGCWWLRFGGSHNN